MTATTENRILKSIRTLRIWSQGGQRAPHKPLLILLAVGRIVSGRKRLVSFAEIDQPLRDLLADFGPSRRSYSSEYPFVRLANDGIWESKGTSGAATRQSNTDIRRSELFRLDVHAGFTEEVFSALKADPKLVRRVTVELLDGHFPESMHPDILQAVGLDLDGLSLSRGRQRNPEFRDRVLVAYEHQCAVCGFNVRLGHAPIALEAAHIRWHQADGPDLEENGIALCSLHHKLFDRGAFTLDDGLRVQVSDRAHGTHGFVEWLMEFHDKPIRAPQRTTFYPASEHVSWHMCEVFQGYGRESIRY
jgi:putative restriction endonuclease